MMSAQAYLAKAEELLARADECTDYETLLEWDGMAAEWRRLAMLAQWQDSMLAALKAGESKT